MQEEFSWAMTENGVPSTTLGLLRNVLGVFAEFSPTVYDRGTELLFFYQNTALPTHTMENNVFISQSKLNLNSQVRKVFVFVSLFQRNT